MVCLSGAVACAGWAVRLEFGSALALYGLGLWSGCEKQGQGSIDRLLLNFCVFSVW